MILTSNYGDGELGGRLTRIVFVFELMKMPSKLFRELGKLCKRKVYLVALQCAAAFSEEVTINRLYYNLQRKSVFH